MGRFLKEKQKKKQTKLKEITCTDPSRSLLSEMQVWGLFDIIHMICTKWGIHQRIGQYVGCVSCLFFTKNISFSFNINCRQNIDPGNILNFVRENDSSFIEWSNIPIKIMKNFVFNSVLATPFSDVVLHHFQMLNLKWAYAFLNFNRDSKYRFTNFQFNF